MIYPKAIILILAFVTHNSIAQESVDKGYRLPNSSVIKDFTVMRLTLEEEHLVKYIIKVNYKIDREEAKLLAKNIIRIAQCFKVDPWILTGLIQKESSFMRDAVSPTNAAGLTQFTSSGFKEVNDQLGFRGKEGATEAATIYFNSRIKECVDPSWIDLWVRAELPEDDVNFYNKLKEEIKKDIPTAITYGAILLKSYVSFIDTKTTKNDIELPTSEIYFQALQIYNGEEGDAKVKYAKNIFLNVQNMYPNEVEFPFLADVVPSN